MRTTKPISIRATLQGESITFLTQEDMSCLITQEGLVDLISQLVFYKEEGRALYPEIYIFDDLPLIRKLVPISQFWHIGTGPKVKDTMLKALKKCAPLTDGGWSIYILRNADSFDFGVFKSGTSMLSVSIAETLIDSGDELVKAILVHQVSDRIIEVKGARADTLLVSFGSDSATATSPIKNQVGFIENITSNVHDSLKEATENFLKKVFLEVLQKGHGTLACVIDSKRSDLPKRLSHGITLDYPISIPDAISDILSKNDLQANAVLEGRFSLITGMLRSDGITVFSDNGQVCAYNVFIKHPDKVLRMATTGGARTRTYLALCELIGNGILSAFIQSQDGKTEFK